MRNDYYFTYLFENSPRPFVLDFEEIDKKKVDAYITVISGWAEILSTGFDRTKSALQNPISHQIP